MQNCVLLITDNENFSQRIEKKILLLRHSDFFKSIDYKNCFEAAKQLEPVLIIYHLKNDEKENYSEINSEIFLKFLQKTKQTKELRNTSVLLLYESIDENVLCTAFERGLTDFIQINSSETEFTVRAIWCLQKRENSFELDKKNDILSRLKIVDKKNNAYTEKYTQKILKEESKNHWGTFAAISPDINVRSKISPQTLMNIIKKTVRSCDILGYATDFKIYLWFGGTKKEDVLKILEKIKSALTDDYTISAGFIETKNVEFDVAEELANKALSQALLKGNSFICAKEPKKSVKKLETEIKNYKLQKETVVKKIESIISPLFYQTQKRIEEKLFETKVTQAVNENFSNFSLENKNGKSTLTIGYAGYTKINIEILHDIKDGDLKADKFFVDTDDLSEQKLEFYIEKFIKDFKNYTKC